MHLLHDNHTLEREQLLKAQPGRGQNPSNAATRAEEALHSGSSVEHSELLDESGACRKPAVERGEACDFAVEVEVVWRRGETSKVSVEILAT